MQDLVAICNATLLPDDPACLSTRRLHAQRCMRSPASYEAAALHFLLAGDVRQAALALAKIGRPAALAAAAELCLMHVAGGRAEESTRQADSAKAGDDEGSDADGVAAAATDSRQLAALGASLCVKACLAAAKQGQLLQPPLPPPPQSAEPAASASDPAADSSSALGAEAPLPDQLQSLFQRAVLSSQRVGRGGGDGAAVAEAAGVLCTLRVARQLRGLLWPNKVGHGAMRSVGAVGKDEERVFEEDEATAGEQHMRGALCQLLQAAALGSSSSSGVPPSASALHARPEAAATAAAVSFIERGSESAPDEHSDPASSHAAPPPPVPLLLPPPLTAVRVATAVAAAWFRSHCHSLLLVPTSGAGEESDEGHSDSSVSSGCDEGGPEEVAGGEQLPGQAGVPLGGRGVSGLGLGLVDEGQAANLEAGVRRLKEALAGRLAAARQGAGVGLGNEGTEDGGTDTEAAGGGERVGEEAGAGSTDESHQVQQAQQAQRAPEQAQRAAALLLVAAGELVRAACADAALGQRPRAAKHAQEGVGVLWLAVGPWPAYVLAPPSASSQPDESAGQGSDGAVKGTGRPVGGGGVGDAASAGGARSGVGVPGDEGTGRADTERKAAGRARPGAVLKYTAQELLLLRGSAAASGANSGGTGGPVGGGGGLGGGGQQGNGDSQGGGIGEAVRQESEGDGGGGATSGEADGGGSSRSGGASGREGSSGGGAGLTREAVAVALEREELSYLLREHDGVDACMLPVNGQIA